MQSIHGSFAIHRVRTVDGHNAIMLVPNPVDELPLSFSMDDARDDIAEIHFPDVQGGRFLPNEYLTLVFSDDCKIELPPYAPTVAVT